MKNVTHNVRPWRHSGMALLLCLGALLALSSCGGEGGGGGEGPGAGPGAGQRRAPLVKVTPVVEASIARTLQLNAEVVSTERVTISATVEGPIGYFPWREGDQVEAGERLIEINREIYQAEVEAAEAALAVAEARLADMRAGAREEEIEKARQSVLEAEQNATYEATDMERIAMLVDAGALPGEQYDQGRVKLVSAQARLDSAQRSLEILERGPTRTALAVQEAARQETAARLAMAHARLEECIVRAPFTATVTQAYVRPGDMAAPRTPLLELVDMQALVLRFSVPEEASAQVREELPLQVTLDAMPGQDISAVITRVYPELNSATRTRSVEAALRENEGITPHMFARVALELDRSENTLIIPMEAILLTPGGDKQVFIIEGDKAEARIVETGMEASGRVQILAGLEPNDQVAVAGNEQLEDGMTVRVQNGSERAGASRGEGRNTERTGGAAS